MTKEEGHSIAAQRAEAYSLEIGRLRNLLRESLQNFETPVWEAMRQKEIFHAEWPKPPVYKEFPSAPSAGEKSKIAAWQKKVDRIAARNEALASEAMRDWETWNARKADFDSKHQKRLAEVEDRLLRYEKREADSVVWYLTKVISSLKYSLAFPRKADLKYASETGVLTLGYELPAPKDMPRVEGVKFVYSRREFRNVEMRVKAFNEFYDTVLYQICLRTVREIFQADSRNVISSVSFQGFVFCHDAKTGQANKICLMLLQVTAAKFRALDLNHVDPAPCFHGLGGIGGPDFFAMRDLRIATLDPAPSRVP